MKKKRNWREIIVTPALELAILCVSVGSAYILTEQLKWGVLVGLILFYLIFILITLVVLKLIRLFIPLKRGVYSYETNPRVFYAWRLHSFMCSTNLSLFYVNGILPPFLRKYFYCFLGARIGSGGVTIEGRLLDPYMIHIEESVRIGDDALLIPNEYAVGSSDLLVLDRIEIKRDAVVGARTTLMPGVMVGENSMVKPMSVVSMNTKIPDNEIWGGNPASKTANVDRPLQVENN